MTLSLQRLIYNIVPVHIINSTTADAKCLGEKRITAILKKSKIHGGWHIRFVISEVLICTEPMADPRPVHFVILLVAIMVLFYSIKTHDEEQTFILW